MHALIAKVDASFRQRRWLVSGAGVLVAVSGGVDSMVLLRVLHTLAKKHGWRLAVAHFNHRLRGAASEGDARFVARVARRLGLECVLESGDVRGLASERGWSVEMAARELRHEFLARTARRLGLRTVALAHHADDQVELFFLRLLRGAGGGMAGMKWGSHSPADKAVRLVRPLLDQPKATLVEFAREEKVRFREDASNASVDILRNRIRRELLPLLRRSYQEGLDRTILRAMEIVGDEAEFAQEAARKWLLGRSALPFARLPVAVQRQSVRLELVRLNLVADFELVERLRLRPGVTHSWQDGWLVRDAASGCVSMQRAVQVWGTPGTRQISLQAACGSVSFDGVEVKWQIKPRATHSAIRHAKNRERFDADIVGPRIVLRHWRPGDRFQPSGMAQAVKLQDLFTNAKIPASERRRLLVAEAADGRVFWVEGLRISEAFKLAGSTRAQLEWRWQRERKEF
ncbi:MAG: tRNA lysidine(34) synthetase TilS [Verrucomicrobia bacterium]|nr:tRNA lysidine(34) synthetase TilS [Verrucomicrobiota bacterium]